MAKHLITLQQIRNAHPCKEGWETLLAALGKPKELSMQVSIGDVAKSNGAQDAFWCCRCIDDRRFLLSLIMPALKRASVHTDDSRVHDCISALEKWLAGDESIGLLAAAYAAAYAADAASAVAADAAYAADAVTSRAAEREQQVLDIIALSPLHAFAEEMA